MILGAVKLIIIICYQILVKRNSEINYALEATSYRINVRTEPKECIICLENLRV